MRPASDEFAAALTGGQSFVTTAEVLEGGQVAATLNVVAGNVSEDEGRAIRRQAQVTLEDPTGDLVPGTAGDLLHPASGREIRLRRGLVIAGEPELIDQGVFRISRPKVHDAGDSLRITLGLYDRAKQVQRTRWTEPFPIGAGGYADDVLQAILEDRAPWLPTASLAPTDRTVPAVTLGAAADNDPWKDAQQIATAAGLELFMDATGVPTARPVPDVGTSPVVASYHDGAGGTIKAVDRDMDEELTYNGVVLRAEGSEVTPFRVEVWDDDPASPTYYLGAYGKVPYFFASPLVTTQAMGLEAVAAVFRRVHGVGHQVRWTAVPDPRLEAGDVVELTRERSRLARSLEAISARTLDLSAAGDMAATTRQRRAAL